MFIITFISSLAGRIRIYFTPNAPVKPERILSLYRDEREFLSFLPEGGIELDLRKKKWNEIFIELKDILEELGGGKSG